MPDKHARAIPQFEAFPKIVSLTPDCRASVSPKRRPMNGKGPARVLAFDLLHLSGWDVSGLSLVERKALLEPLVADKPGLQFNGHETGDGELILKHAGKLGFEGVVSQTIDALRARKPRSMAQSQSAEPPEFVVVGWWIPKGFRPHLGALLLGYYTNDGKLTYAGRGKHRNAC